MTTSRGSRLARDIRHKVEELKNVCQGVSESTANRAPTGRWSPKEILSHLCGPEGSGHLPILRAFLTSDTPTIDLETENPFFSEGRSQASFSQLLNECEREYDRICSFASELSEEQLRRRAHIPQLKDSPFGDYPTLDGMIRGLGEFHLQFHTNHMREILQELGK